MKNEGRFESQLSEATGFVRMWREVMLLLFLFVLTIATMRLERHVVSAIDNVGAVAASTQKTLANIDQEIPKLQESVQSATDSVNATARSTDALIRQINAQVPGVSDQVKVDLQETHRLILESGLTAMEARKASAEERAALPGITAKATQSLDALHGELVQLQTTTRDLDTLVSDPANKKTLKSFADGSAALAATAQDGQQFVHKLLHPTWAHRIWNGSLAVVHALNPL